MLEIIVFIGTLFSCLTIFRLGVHAERRMWLREVTKTEDNYGSDEMRWRHICHFSNMAARQALGIKQRKS
jgi:hypothetical protein